MYPVRGERGQLLCPPVWALETFAHNCIESCDNCWSDWYAASSKFRKQHHKLCRCTRYNPVVCCMLSLQYAGGSRLYIRKFFNNQLFLYWNHFTRCNKLRPSSVRVIPFCWRLPAAMRTVVCKLYATKAWFSNGENARIIPDYWMNGDDIGGAPNVLFITFFFPSSSFISITCFYSKYSWVEEGPGDELFEQFHLERYCWLSTARKAHLPLLKNRTVRIPAICITWWRFLCQCILNI